MKQKTKNNTAVIYARVSSVSDRQNTARQVADLNRYALLSGMEVVSTFEEHISGAKKNDERPVLCECLDYCEANNVGTLLLSELSRLGRNVNEVQVAVCRCINIGLNVYFQKEQFSLFTADGKEHPFAAIFVAVIGTAHRWNEKISNSASTVDAPNTSPMVVSSDAKPEVRKARSRYWRNTQQL